MGPSDISRWGGGGSRNLRNSTTSTLVHWLIQGHRWKNYGFDQRMEVHFATAYKRHIDTYSDNLIHCKGRDNLD